MFEFTVQKIKNRKWLNLCMAAGIILLTAIFSCHPLFESGAARQLLRGQFEAYAQDYRRYPAVFCRVSDVEFQSTGELFGQMDSYEAKWREYVRLDAMASQQYLMFPQNSGSSDLGIKNRMLKVGVMRNLEDHIEIVKGTGFQEAVEEDGAYGCLVSEEMMDHYGVTVGERISFPYLTEGNRSEEVFLVKGIFAMKSAEDPFWHHELSEFNNVLFVSEQSFDVFGAGNVHDKLEASDSLMLDYTQLAPREADRYLDFIRQFQAADPNFSTDMEKLLKHYRQQRRNTAIMLWVLELPCIVLLLLFISMIASQIAVSEESEIAVLQSRGITRQRILLLYLLQSAVLSAVSFIPGILLGFLMCRLAAGTDAFLVFVQKDTSLYRLNPAVLPYAAAAAALSVFLVTFAVWRKSDVTIIEQKALASQKTGKAFWEKYFLDVIFLVVSLYLLYNYSKQSNQISLNIIADKGLDPLVFLDAMLFIFAVGLLFLRLSGYLVRLVSRIGQRWWSPALYASFLQTARTFRKQGMISVFLIMTIAGGIFDANMARTINRNSEERIRYESGCDVKLKELWASRVVRSLEGTSSRYYEEPDCGIYDSLVREGICDSTTKVIYDGNVTVEAGNRSVDTCILMGIHTKEFGMTAQLMDGLNDSHWYHALNALAAVRDGVIISGNMAERFHLKIGDMITYSRYSLKSKTDEDCLGMAVGKICAIVDAFPGYRQYSYPRTAEGEVSEVEQYLVVANIAEVDRIFSTTPYEIWMKLADGREGSQVSDFVQEQGITLAMWDEMEEDIRKNKDSALVQITNGLFTISFLVSLLICTVGFLLYQIMSLKRRELLFGIYRAMGMRIGELRLMLFNEQIFTSFLSILTGGAAGALSTWLFARLIALAYLPQKHNIPIHCCVYYGDMAKLFTVVLGAVVICFGILRTLLQRMDITQALKLGED